MADDNISYKVTNSPSVKKATLVKLSTDGVPKLFCPVCSKALISLNGYVKHVKKHEPPGGFICRYCESRFCTEDELRRHRDANHMTLACRLCKTVNFTNEEDYRTHIRVEHNGIDRELFKCNKCGAEYKTVDPYRRHMSTDCGTIKPYKCDQCSMSFVTKYNLKQHKESHSGASKYCCSYCGKHFLQKGRLVEHERSHTGEKPYKCDVCGKCFAHRESIVTHTTIHTGIRLVECRCCQSRFSCYSNLIKHRRTRPDTCGLPQYDPPKNRVRKHTSRIPATVNPTSEIRVSNVNKIIKPDDQQKLSNLKKENCSTRKSNKAQTVAKRTRKKKMLTASAESDLATHNEGSNNAERVKLKKYLESSPSVAENTKTEPLANCGDSVAHHNNGEEFSRLDSLNDSDVDDERKDEFGSLDAVPSEAEIKQENDDLELAGKGGARPALVKVLHDFECTLVHSIPATTDITAVQIKSEEVNKCGVMQNCLRFLGDCHLEDDIPLEHYQRNKKKLIEHKQVLDILEETELILIKNEENYVQVPLEEDILNTQPDVNGDWDGCIVLLEDVTKHYPELKERASIKVSRNAKATRRKCQNKKINKNSAILRFATSRALKHTAPRDNERKLEKERKRSFRLAKISQRELKERLQLTKKVESHWQCPHCIKIYYMRKPYEKHLRDDHQRPDQEIREIFKRDHTSVATEEAFKCPICDKIYLMEKRLKDHIVRHGPDGKLLYKCPCYCNLYFGTRDEATKHAHLQHKDMLWCELCQKFMTGHEALKSHNARKHGQAKDAVNNSTKRNFICDKCGKKFLGRTQLTDHVRSDCGRLPIYQCTECGKCLTTAGILKTHMLLHKNECPFKCEQCGKAFKIKAQYKSHLKYRHSDEKHFKCHLCPKAYPYRESLLTHMTVHTGIKRFLCNGCGKRFTCVSNLQAHRKVQADTCGLLPLNAKATQYMGVQKGNLLMGAKPEAGLDYVETNTLVAREVLNRNQPMAQELNNRPSNDDLPSIPAPPIMPDAQLLETVLPRNHPGPATELIHTSCGYSCNEIIIK